VHFSSLIAASRFLHHAPTQPNRGASQAECVRWLLCLACVVSSGLDRIRTGFKNGVMKGEKDLHYSRGPQI
jgi:hypothetical protein